MRPTTRVALGLFGSWVIHDLEELATMAATSRKVLSRLPGWVPVPPELRRDGLPQAQVNLAIGLMGVAVAAAAVSGVRSGGRSWLFRSALVGYGLHGFGHLAAATALRGYSTGVVTAPTVVIPYWLWARRVLRREGISDTEDGTILGGPLLVAGLIPVLLAAASAVRRIVRP